MRLTLLALTIVCAAALPAAAATTPKPTAFLGSKSSPNSRGDQAIAYYDARDGFATFLNLRNESGTELKVELAFYGADFGTPFTETVTLPAMSNTTGTTGVGGLLIVDVGALRASGLPATQGVVFATTVDDNGTPIKTNGLSGNFTVANTAIGSAWGSPVLARSAIHPPTSTDTCAPKPPSVTVGTPIDGTTVVLTPIQPTTADLSAYYDPATLAPASLGGNQLIFVSFVDVPGPTFTAQAASTHWTFTAARDSGEGFAPGSIMVNGLVVSDLVSVIGPGITGSSGGALFAADPDPRQLTRFVFFTETLGTFSTGYLLPHR